MRRLLGWALLSAALGACSVKVDPELALPYRCDPASAQGDAQCAGGWRCASDGVCRDPSVGVAIACEVSGDCTGGWHCGPSRVCYDRDEAGAIPCRPEGEPGGESDCRDGWRCPSGGICQQIGVFAPYPCLSSEDCEGGGHCGLLGRCYLRETAGAIPCRPELDDDPALRDCAPDWACSASGRCVDARAFDLRPNGPLSALTAAAVSLPIPAATAVATDCFRSSQETCASGAALTVARGASVELWRVPAGGTVAPPVVITLGAPVTALATLTVPGTQQALTVAVSAAGASLLSWPASGAPSVTPLTLPFLPERVLAPSPGLWFVGVSGAEAVLLARDTGAVLGTVAAPLRTDGGTQDYREISALSIAGDFWLTALAADGVYASRGKVPGGRFLLADGGTPAVPEWTAVRFPGTSHAACPADDGGTGELLALRATSNGSSGSGSYRLTRVAYLPGEGALTGQPATYDLTVRVDVTPAPCAAAGTITAAAQAACPPGGTLEGLHALTAAVLCSVPLPDGGTVTGEADRVGATVALARRELGTQALASQDPGVGLVWAYAGTQGQVIQRLAGTPGVIPLRLGRAPEYFSLEPDGGSLVAHARTLGYGLADAGFELRRVEAAEGCGSLRGAERYRMGTTSIVTSLEGPEGRVDLANSDSISCGQFGTTPVLSEAVQLRDGGTGAIIAARDRVWAEDPLVSAGPSWPVRVSPAPFSTVTSLAVLRPSAVSAGWATAFMVANEQVFELAAERLNRWSSRALASPVGEPFAVWADPEVGRVTYLDGVTYSLPLLAPVSGELPGGQSVGVLREACGAAYALTDLGLYRLEGTGLWEPVPLGLFGERWAQLLTSGDALYAFTESGQAVQIRDTGCQRP